MNLTFFRLVNTQRNISAGTSVPYGVSIFYVCIILFRNGNTRAPFAVLEIVRIERGPRASLSLLPRVPPREGPAGTKDVLRRNLPAEGAGAAAGRDGKVP